MSKVYEQYVYKFYLTAAHSIYIDNSMGQRHSHTWEITLDITNSNKTFIRFDEIEKRINSILDRYQGQYLNEISPLNKINPTLENLCEYFKNIFKYDLAKFGFILLMIEMSESASRSYIINLTKDEFENKSEEEDLLDDLYNTKEVDAEIFLKDISKISEKTDIQEKKVVVNKDNNNDKKYKMEFDIDVDDDDDFDIDIDSNSRSYNKNKIEDFEIIDLDALYADDIEDDEEKKVDKKDNDKFDSFLASLYNSKKQ